MLCAIALSSSIKRTLMLSVSPRSPDTTGALVGSFTNESKW